MCFMWEGSIYNTWVLLKIMKRLSRLRIFYSGAVSISVMWWDYSTTMGTIGRNCHFFCEFVMISTIHEGCSKVGFIQYFGKNKINTKKYLMERI